MSKSFLVILCAGFVALGLAIWVVPPPLPPMLPVVVGGESCFAGTFEAKRLEAADRGLLADGQPVLHNVPHTYGPRTVSAMTHRMTLDDRIVSGRHGMRMKRNCRSAGSVDLHPGRAAPWRELTGRAAHPYPSRWGGESNLPETTRSPARWMETPMPTPLITDSRIVAGMKTQAEQRHALIAAGAKPLGWKAGFGAPAALAKFGITGPQVGFLMQAARIESGGVASLKGWTKPVAEPEIAVYMAEDLAPGADEATIRSAIAGLGAAIELVDFAFPPEDMAAILACNIYQRHVVLGPCNAARAGASLDGITARIFRRGVQSATTTTLEANTGRIIDVVRQVANVTAQFYDGLKAGDVIITGSVVAPITLDADEPSLGHTLDPVGEVSVRFSRG